VLVQFQIEDIRHWAQVRAVGLRGADEEELFWRVRVVGQMHQVPSTVIAEAEKGVRHQPHAVHIRHVLAERKLAVHLHHDAPGVDSQGAREMSGVLLG